MLQLPIALWPNAVWYVPALHRLQSLADVSPVPVWYVPVPHAVQLLLETWPEPVWYVPAPQRLHASEVCCPRPVWYVPIPHKLQSVSAVLPTPVWNVPALHCEQSLLPEPVWNSPFWHRWHVWDDVWPSPVWYFPSPHKSQSCCELKPAPVKTIMLRMNNRWKNIFSPVHRWVTYNHRSVEILKCNQITDHIPHTRHSSCWVGVGKKKKCNCSYIETIEFNGLYITVLSLFSMQFILKINK